MKTVNIKFYDLCDEIDYWKNKANYYKKQFEEERKARSILLNETMLSSQKGIANALMLTLSVEDNKDGSLSISKENRKVLSQTFRQ